MSLACPDCKNPIQRLKDRLCPRCARQFSLNHGVLSFLTSEERFNESPFEEKQLAAWTHSARLRQKIQASPTLSLANEIRIQFSLSGRRDRLFVNELIRHAHAAAKPKILDLGCGGGRQYLAEHGHVVGIDPDISLLKIASAIYDEVYQGDGINLPFTAETFDYVVSSDVIGHIKNEHKDRLFSEIYRVLKPGGRTVHCSEALGQNPWFRFAMRYPALFQRYFIDRPGHIGLELPSKIRQRFLDHSFKEISLRKLSSVIQEPGTLAAFFDNEYRHLSRWISLFVSIDKTLSKNFVLKEMLNFLLEPAAWAIDHLTPLDYAGGVLVIYEKAKAER